MGALPLIGEHRIVAEQRLAAEVFAYIDAGSGDQITTAEATGAWDRYRLRPRVLRDVHQVNTRVTVVGGTGLAMPLLVAPSAYQGAVHPGGEVEMARGVAAAGALLVLSSRSSKRIEDVGGAGCPWWFQVYVMRDRAVTEGMVRRAVHAGATALVLTGDTPYVGRKRRSEAIPVSAEHHLINVVDHLAGDVAGEAAITSSTQDPGVTTDAIAWLAELSGLPVLVKGVLRADDADRCRRAGAAGIIVSNHGGRQLDRAVSTARALPEVAAGAAGPGPGGARGLYVDGGVHDGTAIMTALALGAEAVLVGRPAVWALSAGGADGVQALLAELGADLVRAMALAGAAGVDDLDPSLVTGD